MPPCRFGSLCNGVSHRHQHTRGYLALKTKNWDDEYEGGSNPTIAARLIEATTLTDPGLLFGIVQVGQALLRCNFSELSPYGSALRHVAYA